MEIGDLLAQDGGIVLRGAASSKRQALHAVAEAASAVLGIDSQRVFDALMEREALGATGLGSGVAVPHARLTGLEHVSGVFVRLDAPVAYGAVDDRPVDLLFALFAPPSDGAGHLRALAAVSRAMRSPELRARRLRTWPDAGVRAVRA
ncbi:MAG: transcriptional regulator, partial [Brevundimonas sp.]